jgi:AcrR family transcriptional regulator
MGVKERRERQKEATQEGILAAARSIARTEGWSAVTIRRIADMIEYSPPTIYEYFASKDAILSEVQREGFEQLTEAMRRAAEQTTDPAERLEQIGRTYWRFTQQQPELYQVIHGPDSAGLPTEETLNGGRKAAVVVYEALEQWAQAHGVVLQDPQGAVETLWALLYGLVAVTRLDRVRGGPERAERLAAQAMKDLLFAWAAKEAG